MITKALGGDRINSGKEMDVHLHGFATSRHNITKITRTSQSVGTIVPIYQRLLLKDNKIELDLNASCFTNPTIGPAFAEYDLHINVFSAPLRLYNANLAINLLNEGDKMEDIKFPLIKFVADKIDWTKSPNNQQIGSSCIHQYLGTRGIGDAVDPATQPTVTRYRNANPLLMYVDCCANYYTNKPEGIGYVIHNTAQIENIISIDVFEDEGGWVFKGVLPQGGNTPYTVIEETGIFVNHEIDPNFDWLKVIFTTSVGEKNGDELFISKVAQTTSQYRFYTPKMEYLGITINGWEYRTVSDGIEPQLFEFPLGNINKMRRKILASAELTTPFIIDDTSDAPYGLSLRKEGDIWSKTTNQEGLMLACYNSDIFNNWLDTESIDAIDERTKMMVEGGGITYQAFLMTEKLFSYETRIEMAGNTIDDWEEAAYGTKSKRPAVKPIFEGGLSKTITFDPVVSTAPGTDEPTGTIVGKGVMGPKHHGGKVHVQVDEASYVMVLAHIVPRLDYYQGNDWAGDIFTMEDLHNPNKDKLGYQDLPTDWMATWDTKINAAGQITYYTMGKQLSWTQYQTAFNEDYGHFADRDQEGWMVNGRDYESDPTTRRISDATAYIDPAKWNDIFAYKSRDAMNYRMQYYIGAKIEMLMSANQIPGL